MADEDNCDATSGIENYLVEVRDVMVLSTLFRCPGGIASSDKGKASEKVKGKAADNSR